MELGTASVTSASAIAGPVPRPDREVLFKLERPGFLRFDKTFTTNQRVDDGGFAGRDDAIRAASELTSDRNSSSVAVIGAGGRFELWALTLPGASGPGFDRPIALPPLLAPGDTFSELHDGIVAVVTGANVITREQMLAWR